MNASSTSHSRLRPQFSLRLLLLSLTAFGIGFPIWYRWPYRETAILNGGRSSRTTTWQRQWGGGRLEHGTQTLNGGKITQIYTYRHGKQHGPYVLKLGQTQVETGQYVDGNREGEWAATHTGKHGPLTTRTTWRYNMFHGPCEFVSYSGIKMLANFEAGRLIQLDGEAIDDHLIDVLASKDIDEGTAAEVLRNTELDVVEMPLKDCLIFLADKHQIGFMLDPQLEAKYNLPITGTFRGIDLRSLLVLITVPNGLGCDYRYGSLWITTAEDAKQWHDPTGVSEIRPQPGSILAGAWEAPAIAAVTTAELADAVMQIAPAGIEIDVSRVRATTPNVPAFPTVMNTNGLPFRHALGMLLYETNCRCRQEGEKLVILPPERADGTQTRSAENP
jgi:hypothetical protein